MAETSKKRPRKSKLVPRVDPENIEDTHISQKELQESTLSIIKPSTSTYINASPPVEFSIQVEVEQCEVYSPPRYSTPKCTGPFFLTHKELLEAYAETRERTTSKVDKKLEAEIGNYLGKHPRTPTNEGYEKLIQNCMADWKTWACVSKMRSYIHTYKCHICKIGWWYLQDFRDHIKNHVNITIRFDRQHHESSIVAVDGSWYEDICEIQVEGKCPRCLKTYKGHLALKRKSIFYYCSACNDKFGTCASLFAHEGTCQKYEKLVFQNSIPHESLWKCNLCNIICLTETRFKDHLLLAHVVRSDLPIMYPFQSTCFYCDQKYFMYNLHMCPVKSDNFKCHYCNRNYQTRTLSNIHENGTKDHYYCFVCNKYLSKQCMEMEHIIRHSKNYILAYKCLDCKDHVLGLSNDTMMKHRNLWHKNWSRRRKSCDAVSFDVIILPKTLEKHAEKPITDYLALIKEQKNRPAYKPAGLVKPKDNDDDINKNNLAKRRKPQKHPKNDDDDDKSNDSVNDVIIQETIPEVIEIDHDDDLFIKNTLYVDVKNDENHEKDDDNEVFDDDFHEENDVSQNSIISNSFKLDIEGSNILLSIDNTKQEKIEEKQNIDLQVQVKSERVDEELNSVRETKDSEDINDIERDLEREHNECLAELSKVFRASKNITGKYVDNPIYEELIIKEEPLDEEIYEDDIIVLNTTFDTDVKIENRPEIDINGVKKAKGINDLKTAELDINDLKTAEIDINDLKTAEININDLKSEMNINDLKTAEININDLKAEIDINDFKSEININDLKTAEININNLKTEIDTNDLKPEIDIIDLNTTETDISDLNTDSQQSDDSPKKKKERRERKLYRCRKNCGFIGTHYEFKVHVEMSCIACNRKKDSDYRYSNLAWKELKCTQCNVTYKSLKDYIKHFSIHNLSSQSCPQCYKRYNRQFDLVNHLVGHIKLSFIKIQVLKETSCETSKSSGLYQCKVCSEKLRVQDFFSHWEGHLKFAGEGKLVIDERTSEGFSKGFELQPGQVKAIIDQMISAPDENLKHCVHCSHEFSRRNDCKRHLIEHLLKDAYALLPRYSVLKCQICFTGFPKAEPYKRHMRNHASLPLFKCELCDKCFSDSSNFAKHKKVHNMQNAICDICGKKFHKKIGLTRHLEMHKTMQPIKCNDCDRIFHCLSSYKKHMRSVHEKKTRFLCRICRFRFASLRALWDHMWEAHKERKIEADCPVCDLSFRKYADVRSHVKEKHRSYVNILSKQRLLSAKKITKDDIDKRNEANNKDMEEFLQRTNSIQFSDNTGETLVVVDL